MPKFKPYPGEDPDKAIERISKSKAESGDFVENLLTDIESLSEEVSPLIEGGNANYPMTNAPDRVEKYQMGGSVDDVGADDVGAASAFKPPKVDPFPRPPSYKKGGKVKK